MNILDQINRDKQAEVDARLLDLVPEQVERQPSDEHRPLDFRAALQSKGLSVIAEVKKASPSKGVIRSDFRPVDFALSYQQYGAACISCLTEEAYFQGHPDYLKAIKQKVDIPILRKDFIVDPRQIRESYEMGADAILLIVASLDQQRLEQFHQIARGYGLTVLVEAHDKDEVKRALDAGAKLIGINNRNLITFETSLEHSLECKELIPDDITTVSESGIHQREDCRQLLDVGFDAILVGENLMRAKDPGTRIADLVGGL